METRRIQIDTSADKAVPQFSLPAWRASALALEFGIFESGAVMSLADVSSITLRVRKAPLATALLLERTVASASFSSCTLAQWAAGTHEHLRIELTSAAMNITMGMARSTLHVTLSATLSSGSVRVLGVGSLVLHDANAVAGDAPAEVGTATTQGECDARYLRYDGTQTLDSSKKLQALTNLGLSWLAGATKAGGKITLSDGSVIWLEAP